MIRPNQMLAEATIKKCLGENNCLLDHGRYGKFSKIILLLETYV